MYSFSSYEIFWRIFYQDLLTQLFCLATFCFKDLYHFHKELLCSQQTKIFVTLVFVDCKTDSPKIHYPLSHIRRKENGFKLKLN